MYDTTNKEVVMEIQKESIMELVLKVPEVQLPRLYLLLTGDDPEDELTKDCFAPLVESLSDTDIPSVYMELVKLTAPRTAPLEINMSGATPLVRGSDREAVAVQAAQQIFRDYLAQSRAKRQQASTQTP